MDILSLKKNPSGGENMWKAPSRHMHEDTKTWGLRQELEAQASQQRWWMGWILQVIPRTLGKPVRGFEQSI